LENLGVDEGTARSRILFQKLAFPPFHSQRHYSPGWASASFKGFLHPSRFRVTTVQFLHPSFAASSFTPSSQRNLGISLGCFPPGSLRGTLLDKSSSSGRMTCPAHLNPLRYWRHSSPGHWSTKAPLPRQSGGTNRGGQFLS